MEICGSAEQGVPAAGEEESRRQARVFRVGRSNVIGVVHAAIGWIEMARESLQRVDRLRVSLLGKAIEGTEDAQGGRHREAECFEFHRDFSREDSSRGSSIENDVGGFVGLQQFPVDRNGVVYSSGKWMLRSQAIEHCH